MGLKLDKINTCPIQILFTYLFQWPLSRLFIYFIIAMQITKIESNSLQKSYFCNALPIPQHFGCLYVLYVC